jgi:hydroxypyruvate isomerase
MNPIRQSFCYPLYLPEGMSLLELFKKAKQMGYAAMELWYPPENFEELCSSAKQVGLVIASMGGHRSLQDGLNKKENHDRIEKELIQSIDIAVKYGIVGLICFSGNRNPGQSDEEARENTANGLRRVAKYAEKAGVNLNLELLNSKVNHPGYQCDTTPWGADVVKRVASPRVKLLYDIYHMQVMEGDVIRTIRENIDLIGHFHTAGNPERKDFDEFQELNYRGICKAIAGTKYNLFLGHEFAPKGDRVEALKSAFEICNV